LEKTNKYEYLRFCTPF